MVGQQEADFEVIIPNGKNHIFFNLIEIDSSQNVSFIYNLQIPAK
jgi:hypothetical protein